ncbi:lycopene cyclase domain-containing protein [Sabulilitoribacter multivorans]|uniref:Lycopene cyclase domain-containing protein n=1 Tax=Flaviramulus multivorans TaxID=1304750 RepID=A0ABS9IMD5_9FLAO|nr:lycopene cyclase domain-containing protein [Flaviramulus multivorans]MCF7561755.1 lycopene cyclase domain-containing protein [Flaviramulus multivorans]
MNYLYLLLNLGSLAIPFIFSFHPKLKFYKLWKPLFIGILFSMLIFIPWDIIFTKQGVWGFNDDYFLGIKLFSLPIEEWLFFICIPYACVFTHYALLYYFPSLKLSEAITKTISYLLILVLIVLSIYNYDKWYTLINFLLTILLIRVVTTKNVHLLRHYYLTFLVMLIPFFIVNGVLTGGFIENQVVWYNNEENMGIRLFTIPIEDTAYAFTLILLNLFIMSLSKSKKA